MPLRISHFPLHFLVVIILISALSSCGVYNFTGANIPPEIKTVSVVNFTNQTGLGPPRLPQNFTEKLRDYMQSNSTLRGVNKDGDLQFEGSIVGYTITPQAPTAQELSSRNRLTISIKVKYINTVKEKEGFEAPFFFYFDYPQSQSLSQVEDQAIEEITNQIVFDIFNKALSNW
ncbi:MAG: LptE family protein [Cytophagales bacterium]